MIDFQFRIADGGYYPQLKVQNLQDAFNAILFVLIDLALEKDWHLSILKREEESQDFPNMHLQKLGSKYFCQIFVSENWSPDKEEGWFTLVSAQGMPDHDPFCLADDLLEGSASYFNVGFSPDIAFSKNFLIDKNDLENVLKHFAKSSQANWLKSGNWVNLGLI